MTTYQIYELSARAVMSYAAEQDGVFTFTLNRSATEHCKVPGARHEQDSCAMFHQLMYQLLSLIHISTPSSVRSA